MRSKRGWAVVDKVSGDFVEVGFFEHTCQGVINTIAAYEEDDRAHGIRPRKFHDKYWAGNLEVRRVEIRLVRSK